MSSSEEVSAASTPAVGSEQPADAGTPEPASESASELDATPVHTPPAEASSPAAQDHPAEILIYALPGQTGNKPTDDRDYAQDVLNAVQADLAERLGAAAADINLISQQKQEAALADPCGTGLKQESGPVGGGLSIGLETVLGAGESEYRYMAIGGLAYYCGPN